MQYSNGSLRRGKDSTEKKTSLRLFCLDSHFREEETFLKISLLTHRTNYSSSKKEYPDFYSLFGDTFSYYLQHDLSCLLCNTHKLCLTGTFIGSNGGRTFLENSMVLRDSFFLPDICPANCCTPLRFYCNLFV